MNIRPALSAVNPLPPQAMLLSVSEERSDTSVTRTMTLDGQSIYFRVTGPHLPPKLELYDFAVLASVFTAMRKNRPLHVLGPVSANLLRNLEEFQEAWATWLPDLYHVVPITADKEVEILDADKGKRGVFAFSGGLDSTFALLRHARHKAGRRNIEPAIAVLIQGFDLPLGNAQALGTARQSAEAVLEGLDVPLSVVETNWKRDLCYYWQMEHIAGLAACMNQFNGIADVAVIGGDEGYDYVYVPWGSNQITNDMLSGAMNLWTEGSGFTRSERLAFITQNSDLAPRIRVCWKCADTGRNCGVCEKCIRTQLNFRAIGLEPEGFDRKAGFLRIATIPTHSIDDNYPLIEAQRVASRRKIRGWWRLAAYIAITKNILLAPALIAKDRIKDAIRRNERLYNAIKRKR